MSYLALSRKYRPQTFDEIISQEFVTTTLKNAIELGKITHAYLFSGPRGIGKTSLARIFAKALNCLSPKGVNPCNKCENCIEITKGTSMDVMEIDGASNRGIEEIRQLKEAVKFLPARCQYRVYIIDEVHMLTEPAFNALLKTLEEPPAHIIFIMATTDPHRIPTTILSRCQRFDFTKISFELMYNYLADVLKKESISFEEDAVYMVIRNSEGCMRDALSIVDQIAAYSAGQLNIRDTTLILGQTNKDIINDLFKYIVAEDIKSLPDILEKINLKGMEYKHIVQELTSYTRTLLMGYITENFSTKELTTSEINYFKELIIKTNEHKLFTLFQILEKVNNDLRQFSFEKYIFEMGMFKASKISSLIPIESFTGSANKENNILENSNIKNNNGKITIKKTQSIDTSDRTWQSFTGVLGKIRPSIASNLGYGYISSYYNKSLIIGFSGEKRFHYEIVKKQDNFEFISSEAQKFFNDINHFDIILENDSSKKGIIEKKRDIETYREKKIKEEANNDPILDKLTKAFDSRVINVDIIKNSENKEE